MSNIKYKHTTYPRQMVLDKLIKIILAFLDEHEATISAEDMTSEFWKRHMAQAIAEELIKSGLSFTYLKVAKNDDK